MKWIKLRFENQIKSGNVILHFYLVNNIKPDALHLKTTKQEIQT